MEKKNKDAIDRQTKEAERKRGREETGNTTDKEEQTLKNPKTNSKNLGVTKTKLAKPWQIEGSEARGRKAFTSRL